MGIFDRRSSNGDTVIAQIQYMRCELLDISIVPLAKLESGMCAVARAHQH